MEKNNRSGDVYLGPKCTRTSYSRVYNNKTMSTSDYCLHTQLKFHNSIKL